MVKLEYIITWILRKNKGQFFGSQFICETLKFMRAYAIFPLWLFLWFPIRICTLYKLWDLSKDNYFYIICIPYNLKNSILLKNLFKRKYFPSPTKLEILSLGCNYWKCDKRIFKEIHNWLICSHFFFDILKELGKIVWMSFKYTLIEIRFMIHFYILVNFSKNWHYDELLNVTFLM